MDPMERIKLFISSSTFYYILIVVAYLLAMALVVTFLLKGKQKRKNKVKKIENKHKDIESVDLEAVLGQMQEDVEKPKEEIKTFEEEQEAKAIISYQELLQAVKKDVNEVTKVNLDEVEVFEDPMEQAELPTVKTLSETNENPLEPMVLASEENLEATFEEIIEEPKVVEQPKKVERPIDLVRPKHDSKFQNSEFISPIYGRVNNEVEYPTVPQFQQLQQLEDKTEEKIEEKSENLEKTLVFKPINDNINNDEFLQALKEFRNSLE